MVFFLILKTKSDENKHLNALFRKNYRWGMHPNPLEKCINLPCAYMSQSEKIIAPTSQILATPL